MEHEINVFYDANDEIVNTITNLNVGKSLLFPIGNLTKNIGSLSASFEILSSDTKPILSWLKKFCNGDRKARHYFRMMAKRNARKHK